MDNFGFWTVEVSNVCNAPVGHGLLPLHDVACDWFSSVGRWFPADKGRVVVHLLHRGLFGSVGHLCDGNKRTSSHLSDAARHLNICDCLWLQV